MFLYPLKEGQSTSSQPWSHWSALSWPMGGTDRQWWCHPAQGDGSKYIVLLYIIRKYIFWTKNDCLYNTSCTMCLLLVCCISWRYKTYATTTTSTTKTPAAAIKTTRTIFILFCTHIHPVIRVFRSSFLLPGLLWFKGWGAVHSHVAVTLLESVELPWELKLARRIQKGRDLNGYVHTQTRGGGFWLYFCT